MADKKKAIHWLMIFMIIVFTGCSILDTITENFDWNAFILKALGIMLSTFSSIWIVPKLKRRTKAGLKTDLEILKLMQETDHPNKKDLQDYVGSVIETIYTKETGKFGLHSPIKNPFIFILGIVCLPIFVIWTVTLYPNGWMFLTGFLAFASLGWILIGFEEPRTQLQGKAMPNL